MVADDRSRIAQELHDRVQQTLFTIGLKAEWMMEQLARYSSLGGAVHTIEQVGSVGTAQVRDAIFELSSTELQEGGFVSILYALIQNLRETSSIEIDLVVAECAVPLPSHIENTLFTIAQEALSNARRHALATIVIVTVQVTSEQAALVVQDNGIGLSTQALQPYPNNTIHLALNGMHHPVQKLGGQFLLANVDAGGLIVKAG